MLLKYFSILKFYNPKNFADVVCNFLKGSYHRDNRFDGNDGTVWD